METINYIKTRMMSDLEIEDNLENLSNELIESDNILIDDSKGSLFITLYNEQNRRKDNNTPIKKEVKGR